MVKYSRQREGILNNLTQRTDHPTAEMIYFDMRKSFPQISLGTVYRNLALLEELGDIIRIPTGSGPDRYDGNAKPHCHFLCRTCGELSDLHNLRPDVEQQLAKEVLERYSAVVESSQVLLSGTCSGCRNRQSES